MADPNTPTQTNTGNNAGQQTGMESSLSNWVGPYVTDMLGKGQALSNQGYQAYTGPLAAGQSNLQNQAFTGLAGLAVPTETNQAAANVGNIANQYGNAAYNPTQFTSGTFDNAAAQRYMNPYLMSAMQPQLDEATRQSQIQNLANRASLTKAGAYGGGRGALMESENQRNLLSNLSNITGTGYKNAYDAAMAQYNADQSRGLQTQQAQESANQFGANYGLSALDKQLAATKLQSDLANQNFGNQLTLNNAQMAAGATQRDIEQQGIAADINQFNEEQQYPYKQVQFQQSLLQGLPLQTQSYSYSEPSALSQLLNTAGGVQELYDKLFPSTSSKTSAGTTGSTGTTSK